MTLVKPPYKPSITKDEAINLICNHLYPDKEKSGAKKLIRQRIRQAQKDGHFKTPLTKYTFNTKEFFEWAVTSKDWQSLNSKKYQAEVDLYSLAAIVINLSVTTQCYLLSTAWATRAR